MIVSEYCIHYILYNSTQEIKITKKERTPIKKGSLELLFIDLFHLGLLFAGEPLLLLDKRKFCHLQLALF